jgi:SAM-dependent methyltransferase
MGTAPNLRPGAFAGTAEAYLRYRPPYPAALLDDLIMRARLPFRPVLLDLACGPGRVSLALAASFDRVLALDLELEMVRVGAVEAARRDVTNVTWLVGRAEEANFEPESVDVITIGDAFHRLDQNAVITNALNWLKPGGCIVTLGTRGLLAGGEDWMDTVAMIARRRLPAGAAAARRGAAVTPEAVADVLERSGFVDVQTHSFSQPWEWSFEDVVGYLRSTSVCSEQALGQDLVELESDLRGALEGQGPFRERLQAGYTMARRPTV